MKSVFILVATSEHYERSLLKIWLLKAMHSNVVLSTAVCVNQSRWGSVGLDFT